MSERDNGANTFERIKMLNAFQRLGNTVYEKNVDPLCLLEVRLYWAVKMLSFWAAWAEITN